MQLEDGTQVRERKSALMEVIELQRKLLQRREDSTSTGDDSEEMAWYTEQTKRLERFKLALNTLRLQPDEFELWVPSEWMPGCRAGTRGMAACKLRINARSQMALVPGDTAARPGGDAATPSADGSGEPSEDAEACRPRVFFIDELRVIRSEAEPSPVKREGPSMATLVLGWRRVEDGGGTGCSLRCLSPEAAELSEVLGQHLQRYKQARVATAARLAQLHALKCIPYRSSNEAHEQLLRRLWECGFPGVALTQRVTTEWGRLGFQGDDPATDFRGMGVLGLHNLVYFGEHYPDVFARLIEKQRKRDYPLACAGIHVTSMLLELLHLAEGDRDIPPGRLPAEGHAEGHGTAAEVQGRPPFSEAWDSDMFRFFCHMFYRERPFEDMYCFSLRMLDRIFVSLDADYADFSTVRRGSEVVRW